jgi:hypothetical protein
MKMYEQTRSDLEPYRTAGTEGTNMLMSALPELTSQINLDQAWLEGTPGYKFAKTQGLKSTQSGAAARGLGKSGAAVKAASSYATGLADQTYQNQYNNELAQREQRYNALMGVSQLGSNAAAQTGQAATTTGQGVASNTIAGGTAQAAGVVGASNALTGAVQNYLGYDLAKNATNMYSPTSYGYGRTV